jgi:hypothetical protein
MLNFDKPIIIQDPGTIVNDINKLPYSQKQATDVRQGPFFSEAKEYSARYFAYLVAKAGGGLHLD